MCTLYALMRRTKFNLSISNLGSWGKAVKMTADYLTGNVKANQLLKSQPKDFTDGERATCQALFLGALRNGHRINAVLQPFIKRRPRSFIEAILLVAGYEILSAPDEKRPQIVHHAVENSKPLAHESETRLLNALLRKLPDALSRTHPNNRPDIFFSHPRWLFRRWNKQFGLPTTIQLMQWNQETPATYIKLYNKPEALPDGLEATQWKDFYKIAPEASWLKHIQPLLNKGDAYIKDPSTRLATNLLAPSKSEHILDICAAPGGKTYDIAHQMQLNGLIVALDLPGNRIERLQKNLGALGSTLLKCSIIEANLLEISDQHFLERQLPCRYDAVMLDAPCSNTGVIQRRTDVKWRLNPGDIHACIDLQHRLIAAASRFLKPGGRLVYSTCSIDPDENQTVVDTFLKSKEGKHFVLQESKISLPWETKHDGAGAFLLISKTQRPSNI